jgi:heme oxygenase (biliverdin-IX-beta and delta-forming)
MLLESLRERTASLHARVERSTDLPKRCSSVRAYRELLLRLLGFYEPAEERLSFFDWRVLGIDFEQRRKVPLLVRDIRTLAGDPRNCSPISQDELPRIPTLSAAVGVLYVMEGATLGGQFISRHVRDVLGIGPSTGGSFHAAYGCNTGAMWREFREAANGYCDVRVDRIDEAVTAAVATFEAFDRWLGE